MTITSSYGAFAYAYDKALGERFFRSARRVLAQLLERYPTTDKTHLDLACGTGLAMEFFAARGFRSIGIDASLPMLSVARTRAQRLVASDFRELPLRRRFSRITCLYDSLNHLKNRADLTAVFRAVRKVMAPDSLFFFDMNHPDVYPAVWGMKEPFVSSGPGFHLEMATAFRRRDATGLALVSGWALLPSGRRVEIAERHEQRAYSEREIVESLGEAGLVPAEVIDFDPFKDGGELEAEGVKLFFVCKAASAEL
ncbi:MAG TPA: class I SAM-dependent methyltransferase [Thermoanaerobaculia bacterium]|nr:class I SAM-dependent methyltransferase [Thermoanaerobaculia bacterium]